MTTRHVLPSTLACALLAAILLAGCQGQPAANPIPTTTPSAASATPATTATPPTSATSPGATAPLPTSPTSRPGRPECATADLRLSLSFDGVAAGSVYQELVFTNAGAGTCWMAGFPGVSFVTGDDGRQVGAPAFRSGRSGERVTIAPGRSAYATLQQGNSGNYDPAACQPTAVRGLRVYPPDSRTALFVPYATTACSATNLPSGQLLVRTVAARPAG